MAAKIKGPLTLGSAAADTDYNSQMRDLMGQLVQTPEEQQKDELLAWSGGLTDPNGQGRIGDSMIHASKAQSDYRMEDRKLRAQYIPLIMSALGTQAAQAQASQMPSTLRGMSPAALGALNVATGKDWTTQWEYDNGLKTSPSGNYQIAYHGGTPYIAGALPATDKPAPIIQGGAVVGAANLPGAAQATAESAAATAGGKGLGEAPFRTTKVIGPNLAEMEVPMTTAFPSMEKLPQFSTGQFPLGGQVPPTPQPPQGALSMGQAGPPPVPSGGVTVPQMPPGLSAPMPPSVIPAPGVDRPPPIPKQQQAALDADRVNIYKQELAKTQARLAEIANPVADPKQEQLRQAEVARLGKDAIGITRELERIGGKAPTVATAPASPSQAVQPSPQVPVGVQTGLSPVQKMQITAIEEGNKRWNTTFNELQQQKLRDDKEELSVNRIATSFKGMGETGSIDTPLRKGAAEVLSFFGVPAEKRYLENYETAQQAIKERVNAAIRADAGVATEGDANRHEQAMVSLTGKPGYNEYMLDVYRATMERNREKLNFYTRAKSKVEDGNLESITDAWNQKAQKPLMDMPSMRKWKERYGWK